MLRKVKIKLPKAKNGIEARMKDLYTRKDLQKAVELNEFGTKHMEVGRTLSAVPREEANLEAEGGETAITNLNNDGIPENYTIRGPRHTSGGVPLKLKEDSFIFSDTKSMKIKDEKILKMFGMSPKSGGYTPADISKKFDLNKYKKILLDPESDKLQRSTAELMIANYNHKLAQLALLQESKKGFPQGIPDVAIPYLTNISIDPNNILGMQQGQQEMPLEEDQGQAKYGKNIISKLQSRKNEYPEFYKETGGTPGLGKRLVQINSLPKAAKGKSQDCPPGYRKAKSNAGYYSSACLPDKLVDKLEAGYIKLDDDFDKAFDKLYELAGSDLKSEMTPDEKDYLMSMPDEDIDKIENFPDQSSRVEPKKEEETKIEDIKQPDQPKKNFFQRLRDAESNDNYVPGMGRGLEFNFDLSKMYDRMGERKAAREQRREERQDAREERQQNRQDARQREKDVRDLKRELRRNPQMAASLFGPSSQAATQNQASSSQAATTQPETSTKTTKKQNIPDSAIKHDENDANYDMSKVKAGDYIKGKDGKWRKVKGLTAGGLSGGSMSGADNYKKFFGTDIQDDADKVKVILSEKAKDPKSDITVDKNGKYNFGPNSGDSLTLEEKELISKVSGYQGAGGYGAKEFGLELGSQKKNKHGFVGFVDPDLLEYQYWKSRKENQNKTVAEFEQSTPEERKANRIGYLKKLGYSDDELKNLGTKIDDPNQLYTENFVRGKTKIVKGKLVGDDTSFVGRIQKAFPKDKFRPYKQDDYWLGWEHADFYKENEPSLDLEDVPEEVMTETEKKKADPKYRMPETDAPFFAQDVLGVTGAAFDLMNVKKFMPWQASPNLHLPEPVYYDPTRELAANAEMANIGTQGAQLFAGPQAFNARYSQIQGNAAKNAADILARYNNQNVGIANQYENVKAQMLNQDEINRANAATNLFDKTTIANQMYQNEKNMARQNLRNAFKDALTNRANAQVLNALYPQYHIDTPSGGMLTWMGGRDLDTNATSPEDLLTTMDKLRGTHKGWSDETYRKAAMNQLGQADNDLADEYLKQFYRTMPTTDQGQ